MAAGVGSEGCVDCAEEEEEGEEGEEDYLEGCWFFGAVVYECHSSCFLLLVLMGMGDVVM